MDRLGQEYSDKLIFNFSIFPGSSAENATSDVVVEPYNSVFTLASLVDNSHADFMIENPALYRICQRGLKVAQPTFADINYIVAQAMSNTTASLRFAGYQNNSDIRKLCTNLVPFPRLHFMMQGQAPLLARGESKYYSLGVPQITEMMFDPASIMTNCDPK